MFSEDMFSIKIPGLSPLQYLQLFSHRNKCFGFVIISINFFFDSCFNKTQCNHLKCVVVFVFFATQTLTETDCSSSIPLPNAVV